VVKAADYIDSLRQQRMTAAYRAADSAAFYGLVPQSISHEGYSAKPMHSYWDDAFAVKGLADAAFLAGALGDAARAARYGAMRDTMRRDVVASYERAMAAHHIDYLPGSVELGDFDATSTTISVNPGGGLEFLPRGAVERTFDKYLAEFRARRDGAKPWDAYTPYELRTVGTFVRLGRPEVAHELLDFFFAGQRPAAWNQWAEVVWRDPATPKFIGDMPHTWVGSDFIRSVLDMLAYEREADSSLVVGAGVRPEWVTEAPGVSVEGLRTPYGRVSLTMRGDGREVRVRLGGDLRVPPGGIVVRSPAADPPVAATVNGAPARVSGAREIVVRQLPAEVVLKY
jgi:hypothetical protein